MYRALRLPILLKRAFSRAADHDVFNVAQSAAYSGIVALFPALIVCAALITLLPDTGPVRAELSEFFRRVLPANTVPVLAGYFSPKRQTQSSTRALVIAILVSISGAGSVIATLMEGLRRAAGLPADCWSFLDRRRRAYVLVLVSLLPLACSSILVIFGNWLAFWMTRRLGPGLHDLVLLLILVMRWTVASAGSVGLIALLYREGVPERQSWWRVLPGAVVATFLWLLTTLVFGWYVTRFANYTQVYGSLGAGIALLFWLYLVALSVLTGAEFNAELRKERVT